MAKPSRIVEEFPLIWMKSWCLVQAASVSPWLGLYASASILMSIFLSATDSGILILEICGSSKLLPSGRGWQFQKRFILRYIHWTFISLESTGVQLKRLFNMDMWLCVVKYTFSMARETKVLAYILHCPWSQTVYTQHHLEIKTD